MSTRPVRANLLSLDALKARIGSETGVSEWRVIDQARINAFADATDDWQFIHIDPEAAAKTPFGTTIAHGFLTLSMLSAFAYEALPGVEGARMGVNYGLNKVRFMAPVKSGKRIRARFTLTAFEERSPGVMQSTNAVTVEIEGEDKPALMAEWIGLAYL